MTRPATIAEADPSWSKEIPGRLRAAVRAYDLTGGGDWRPLGELSTKTTLVGIDVVGEAAVVERGRFVAPGTVHVHLSYDQNAGREPTEFDESFPARVFFKITDGTVTIEEIKIDTRPFFHVT